MGQAKGQILFNHLRQSLLSEALELPLSFHLHFLISERLGRKRDCEYEHNRLRQWRAGSREAELVQGTRANTMLEVIKKGRIWVAQMLAIGRAVANTEHQSIEARR